MAVKTICPECETDIRVYRREAMDHYKRADAYGAEIGRLLGLLRDLVKSVEARHKLDAGFGGMGVNILQEDASKIHWHLREAKKYLGQQDQKDCDCFAPMHWVYPQGGDCPKCGGHIPPTKEVKP